MSSSSKGPIAWMAANPVAANVLMIVFLVGGLIMAGKVKQEVFPEFTADTVSITVPYPGASPEEVEKGVILSVEEAVQGLDGVKEITSRSSEGSGRVTVEIVEGANLQQLAQDIQSAIDRITSFPEEIEQPQIAIDTRRIDVVSLVVYGRQSDQVLREKAEEIRDTLIQDPEITQVDLDGVRPYEISIDVPQAALRKYGLTLGQIAAVIERNAIDLPGGGIKTSGGEILLRMKDRRDVGREFGLIPIIANNDGTEILLEDIAEIRDGFEERDRFATYNGLPAVMVDVYRIGDQTPISVADAVLARMADIRANLPPNLDIAVLNNRADVFRQRVDLLLGNGYLGLALVFIFLALFLEIRLAFWVSLGIPISILGSILFLPSMDVSLNMNSLFAFIITLGIVVDDAIVVGENVYFYRQAGHSPLEAAVIGARGIAGPVVFSVLTNIVAFLPIYVIPGVMGKFFKQIPLVVIAVFAISLIESLFILPAHLAHSRDRQRRGLRGKIHDLQQGFSGWFSRQVRTRYAPFLSLALKHRYITLAAGATVLMITIAYVDSGRMGMTLFPTIESDASEVTATLPFGSAIQKTEAVQDRLVRSALKVAEENGGDQLLEGIFANIGTSAGSHVVRIRAYLKPPDQRPVSTSDFTEKWRKDVGRIPGLENIKFRSDAGGPGSREGLTIELSHRDTDILEAAAAELAEAIRQFPNAKDVDDGFEPGKPQLDFRILPQGRSIGLTSTDVARQVRHAYYGVEALRQQRGRNEIKVTVRLPENERSTEYGLEELMLRSPSGAEIPLRQAVVTDRGRAYTVINRRDGRRIVQVTADITPNDKTQEVINALQKDVLPGLTASRPGLKYSFEGRQAEMRESTQSLIQGLLLAVIAIYALLAVPFKSYFQPLIIMMSIPFGMVGAVLGHLIMGYSLSIPSLFGIVALSGVVVNDSLVLIDLTNQKTRDGAAPMTAIVEAGIHRFRPILLTTVTTFGGLAPMILETSRQARYLIPMALSLGFGILFATCITLVLVPAFYLAFEDIRNAVGRYRGSGRDARTGHSA